MLTSFSDDEALFDAIMAGASGYVLKEVGGSDLVSDIRKVAAGHSLLDPVSDGSGHGPDPVPSARRAARSISPPRKSASSDTSPRGSPTGRSPS